MSIQGAFTKTKRREVIEAILPWDVSLVRSLEDILDEIIGAMRDPPHPMEDVSTEPRWRQRIEALAHEARSALAMAREGR